MVRSISGALHCLRVAPLLAAPSYVPPVEDSLSTHQRAERDPVSPTLSRRRLLRLAGLAAATPALLPAAAPAAAGAPRVPTDDGGAAAAARAYRTAFSAAVQKDENVRAFTGPGREFLYRPRQLLVADRDAKRVLQLLRKLDHRFKTGDGFAGTTRVVFADEVDIPRLVTLLRDKEQWPGQPVPAVQPHHVTIGHENIMGNPDCPPVSAAALDAPQPAHSHLGKGVLVGICDTGIWRDAGVFHPQWLHGGYLPEADDEDPLYRYADVLALQGGHGTFVAGVLRQAAPAVRFDPEPALTDAGIGDEEMLVHALGRLDRRTAIVNLSLGCYTQDDVAPLPVVNQLSALGRDVVVVASAGNSGDRRPSWPAALPEVLAVAAVHTDATTGAVLPAGYSNYGDWVDACAPGERTSTYVTGRLELPGLAPIVFPGFARWSGTSFAAPHVAGRLAAIITERGCTAAQAREHLLAGGDLAAGYGVLVE